uniref:DUF6824 domain-containing protein n=1 Tax=Amphora coffeiformis TaxID=265554 RepID=A0A7S3KW51_9STRA|eukprot:scaffold34607_cov177-Amphora_coffeaeformis.AAC.1
MAFDTMSPSSPVSSGNQTSPQVTPDPNNKQDDYINEGVKDPRPHDVLCGRGGSINSHPGNERFRQLVDKRKRVYLTARFKREKRLIASSIVSEIRALDPPGRFLQMEKSSGLWKDIGDEKARDKTSQALRENAPKIRADIEEETLEKRAEMQKEEDVQRHQAAVAQQQHQHASPSAPPPQMAGYYPPHPGWGPYPPPPHPSYYGYGHPPPPPHGAPPPPHPSYYPPPPQQHAPHHAPPPHSGWGYYPPPPQQAPQTPKSSVADYISSGAESVTESVKRWSSSFSLTGGDRGGSSDPHGDNHSVNSRPLPYVHEDSKKRSRMVKFSSDTKRNNKRTYSRRNSASSMTNSILSGLSEDHDLEPHGMDEDIENRSLMSSVANHILGSIGSWDTASILCGVDNTDRDSAPFPGGRHENVNHHHHVQHGDMMDEDEMNVEWEGQEVQLMEKNDQDSVASEDRMPPPQRQVQHHDNHSMAFSSLGSCHSWMPEQFNDAASSFFGSIRGDSEGQHQGHDSHMEQQMDYSVHTENYSIGGSIGGNSLTRVFEHDPMPDSTGSAVGTPNMSHRSLNQVPSWERNFRSRSPLSVGSDDADDISLISKESSKFSRESREGGISVSPVNTPRDGGAVWGTKE